MANELAAESALALVDYVRRLTGVELGLAELPRFVVRSVSPAPVDVAQEFEALLVRSVAELDQAQAGLRGVRRPTTN